METKLKNMLRLFLDSIRDYEHESGSKICNDERSSEEFVDIFIDSEDAFDYKDIMEGRLKYNINETMYIQITDKGWKHLRDTVGKDYIDACIKVPAYEKVIGTEVWYKLQCHNIFDLFPTNPGMKTLFNTNVMFDVKSFDI